MSKVANCPQCGKRVCVSDRTGLNYCPWCSYSFKAERERALLPKNPVQTSLFNVLDYKKTTWNGG